MERRSLENELGDREARKVDIDAKIEDIQDELRTYRKQPKIPELDVIIKKLETELANLVKEKADLSK